MSVSQNCFFCCKATTDSFKDGEDSSTNSQLDKCKNNNEAMSKIILQISYYLKVNRNLVPKNKSLSSSIRICGECRDISANLGKLCSLLEVTQMKINYYLNLLTDKILIKNEHTDYQQSNITNFQEIFHSKCLTKLAKCDANPILQLTKCRNPIPTVKQVFKEDTNDATMMNEYSDEQLIISQNVFTNLNPGDDYNDSIDAEENGRNLKVGNGLKNVRKSIQKLPRIFSCEYCPLTFHSSRNKNSHVSAVHLRKPTSKPGSHMIKPCEYCGAMISSRNLSTHRKRHFGYKNSKKANLSPKKIVKFKRCETCKKMFQMGWSIRQHLRESIECSAKAKFKCGKCGGIFSRNNNLQRHLAEVCEKSIEPNQIKIKVEIR